MFTKQISSLVGRLRGILPEPAIHAFEDTLGGCDQSLEHRGPVSVEIDGDDRVNGQDDRYRMPTVCLANDDPIAAVTASNPNATFSGETCLTDCVEGGLALRAIGPSVLDETRIKTAYVGSLKDLCGNPFPTGSGSQIERFKITNALPDPADPSISLAKLMSWNGTSYAVTGSDIAVVDFTANSEFKNRWKVDYQGWATPQSDRTSVTISSTQYDVYECVWVETRTRFIEFETTATMSGTPGSAAANVLYSWGSDDGADAPNSITVHDRLSKMSGESPGMKGLAIYDEVSDKYVIVADRSGSGSVSDQIFRFRLTASLSFSATSAAATLINSSGTAIGSAIQVHDTVGEWAGEAGYEGWCAYKSDTSQYEIVFMEGQSRYLVFTLTSDLSGGTATATVGTTWGRTDNGKAPTGTINVSDPNNLFRRAKTGDIGIAVWNDATDTYQVLECESKAGQISGQVTSDVGLSASTISVTVGNSWGTQQDRTSPGSTVSVDCTRFNLYEFKGTKSGAEVIATYDEATDEYIAVNSQMIADAIRFTLSNDLSVSGAVVVDSAMGGMSPGGVATVDNTGSLFPKALQGAEGVALYNGANWAVVECQSQAGELAFETNNFYSNKVSQNVDNEQTWGTQQDVQSVSSADVKDIHGLFNLSKPGAKGYAILDAEADQSVYNVVYQETYAKHIVYTADQSYESTDSDFTASVSEHHSGQNPANSVKVRNVFQKEGSSGDKGLAFLDTENSTPQDPEYIDIPISALPESDKVFWGTCVSNWFSGDHCAHVFVTLRYSCHQVNKPGTEDPPEINENDSQYDSASVGSDTVSGLKVLLPRGASSSGKTRQQDPNVVAGQVIAFRKTSSGEYVAVSDYNDDAIGTVKIWVKNSGPDSQYAQSSCPTGWGEMDGTQNRNLDNGKGSGIDMRDHFPMMVGAETKIGEKGGRNVLPEAELDHYHHIEPDTPDYTQFSYVQGDTPQNIIDSGFCNDKNGKPFDPKQRNGSDDDNPYYVNDVSTQACIDAFGPINILNQNINIIFIERLDNSQGTMNSSDDLGWSVEQ